MSTVGIRTVGNLDTEALTTVLEQAARLFDPASQHALDTDWFTCGVVNLAAKVTGLSPSAVTTCLSWLHSTLVPHDVYVSTSAYGVQADCFTCAVDLLEGYEPVDLEVARSVAETVAAVHRSFNPGVPETH